MLIRHAPVAEPGRLYGRTDAAVGADGLAVAAALGRSLERPATLVTSPALRCRQTAAALWPSVPAEVDNRLAEQDFGAWDGLPLAEVPNLGALSGEALAAARPPGGESFADLCARAAPALAELAARDGTVAIVVHAGTVRAALALALGRPGVALAFEVEPLSVTRLRPVPGGFSIGCVNYRWQVATAW